MGGSPKHNPLPGQVFNKFTVIGEASRRDTDNHRRFYCRCSCGHETIVGVSPLVHGIIKSCSYCSHRTHGQSRTVLFKLWGTIKSRCSNPNFPSFHNYGGRGIKVCAEWEHNFKQFAVDMGERPFEDAEIDRIDNSKGYSKENCRWTTPLINSRNRRVNVYVEYEGERCCLSEWAEHLGVNYYTFHKRCQKDGRRETIEYYFNLLVCEDAAICAD